MCERHGSVASCTRINHRGRRTQACVPTRNRTTNFHPMGRPTNSSLQARADSSSFKTAFSLPFCPNFCRSFKRELRSQELVRGWLQPRWGKQQGAAGLWRACRASSTPTCPGLGALSRRKASSGNFDSSPLHTWKPLKAVPAQPVAFPPTAMGSPKGLPHCHFPTTAHFRPVVQGRLPSDFHTSP